MKYKWLNQKNNSKIILFFNGWGMDETVVKHLEYDDYDVLMFFDYNFLETDFNFSTLDQYKEKYLIAWSMGVMVATLFNIDYSSKTAVNGTLKPIDDKYGIPKKIYDLTVRAFSPAGAEKFIKNMFNGKCDIENISREFENQKSELSALMNYKADLDFQYDKVIISTEDKIIPTKNQCLFWGKEPNTEGGHAPFNRFKKWSGLI